MQLHTNYIVKFQYIGATLGCLHALPYAHYMCLSKSYLSLAVINGQLRRKYTTDISPYLNTVEKDRRSLLSVVSLLRHVTISVSCCFHKPVWSLLLLFFLKPFVKVCILSWISSTPISCAHDFPPLPGKVNFPGNAATWYGKVPIGSCSAFLEAVDLPLSVVCVHSRRAPNWTHLLSAKYSIIRDDCFAITLQKMHLLLLAGHWLGAPPDVFHFPVAFR